MTIEQRAALETMIADLEWSGDASGAAAIREALEELDALGQEVKLLREVAKQADWAMALGDEHCEWRRRFGKAV